MACELRGQVCVDIDTGLQVAEEGSLEQEAAAKAPADAAEAAKEAEVRTQVAGVSLCASRELLRRSKQCLAVITCGQSL